MKSILKKVYAILVLVVPLGILFPSDTSWVRKLLRLLMLLLFALGAFLVYNNYQQRAQMAVQGITLPDWDTCTVREIQDFAQRYAGRLSPQEEVRLRTLIDTQLKQLQYAREILKGTSSNWL